MSASVPGDRLVLVTGADGRLGYSTALRFAAEGASLILHTHDRHNAERTLDRLVADGIDPRSIRMVTADFRRLGEVDELATRLCAELPALDVLVNAASVPGAPGRTHTEDGFELTLQVNYLAPQRLTMALVDALAAARGRVVSVTSRMHVGGNIDYSDLDRKRGIYAPTAVYAQSKLALTMFTRSLAETGPGGLTAVSVHPAEFEIDMPYLRSHIDAPMEEAAEVIATLADPAFPVLDGGYYVGTESAIPAGLVRNSRARTRLAAWSNGLLVTA
ncbi:SDR family NAD(P)-dependent oxidoreductase [Nocardia sp. NPDC051833]|uniref:SDR family NAD(P)-dependent oxidoreductase n=1 Tax=Nocardia sp. NPDC051833 TaxID=3155674 RepID=UPI00342EFD1A